MPFGHIEPFGEVGVVHVPVVGLQTPASWQVIGVQLVVEIGMPHTPALQVSPVVHAFWSSQVVPSARAGNTHMPVLRLHVPAVWQVSGAGHIESLLHAHMLVPPRHAPPMHASPMVQARLSEQVVPSVAGGLSQTPFAGLQVPLTWHWSMGRQFTVEVGVPQLPASHVSPLVHALWSLHAVPAGRFTYWQTPVEVLHTTLAWHWFGAGQSLSIVQPHATTCGVQVPVWHSSPVVQLRPSSHGVPLVAFGFEQVPVIGSQVPATWHWPLAVQLTVLVGAPQLPAWQVSPVVQAFWSLQTVPSARFAYWQVPAATLQVPG